MLNLSGHELDYLLTTSLGSAPWKRPSSSVDFNKWPPNASKERNSSKRKCPRNPLDEVPRRIDRRPFHYRTPPNRVTPCPENSSSMNYRMTFCSLSFGIFLPSICSTSDSSLDDGTPCRRTKVSGVSWRTSTVFNNQHRPPLRSRAFKPISTSTSETNSNLFSRPNSIH